MRVEVFVESHLTRAAGPLKIPLAAFSGKARRLAAFERDR